MKNKKHIIRRGNRTFIAQKNKNEEVKKKIINRIWNVQKNDNKIYDYEKVGRTALHCKQ